MPHGCDEPVMTNSQAVQAHVTLPLAAPRRRMHAVLTGIGYGLRASYNLGLGCYLLATEHTRSHLANTDEQHLCKQTSFRCDLPCSGRTVSHRIDNRQRSGADSDLALAGLAECSTQRHGLEC